jgi:hypothetical protein
VSDGREFCETVCWMCGVPSAWLVYARRDDPDSEWLMTCEKHKFEAFS